MEMSFSDLLSLYQASVEEAHRTWNYFSLACVGLVTVVWTVTNLSRVQFVAISFLFAGFAAGNGYVVCKAQNSRVEAAGAIRAYVESQGGAGDAAEGGSAELYKQAKASVLKTIRPAATWQVVLTHIGIDLGVLIFIWFRCRSLGQC